MLGCVNRVLNSARTEPAKHAASEDGVARVWSMIGLASHNDLPQAIGKRFAVRCLAAGATIPTLFPTWILILTMNSPTVRNR